ncbi:MAG: aminotransferase class V-fold PLP-dependent enzyme, partial [Bacteroidota bacterium]
TKIESLRNYFIEQLKENFSGVTFNGDYDGRYLFTVLNVAFPHNDKSELLLFNLDVAGIAASSGSACSSGSDVGSHVLNAIGCGDDKVCIRFSFSDYNTIDEVDYAISKLKELMPQTSAVH